MPTLTELKTYLGAADASQWSDAELTAVLASEAAAQARRLRPTTLTLPDVVEALLRRCACNLAMRKFPLGMAMSSGGDEATRVTGRDPEVRRLEAPYRKVAVG